MRITLDKWFTAQRAQAAQFVAEGKTEDEIIGALKISSRTLFKWKNNALFQARVAEVIEQTAKALQAQGVMTKASRLISLQDRVKRMTALIEARAEEMRTTQEVAGGETGLLVRDYKGKDADIAVYKFDAALVRELREHEKQAAIELGEWTDKQEHRVAVTAPITIIEVATTED